MNIEEHKALFDEAIRLWHEGSFNEALFTLLNLAKEYPKYPAVFGVIGSVYKEMGDLENATKYFQYTVELSPKSELASLGLFHSLFKMGHKNRAFSEAQRFLSISKSDEYTRLLVDLNITLSDNPANYIKMTDEPSLN